MIELRLPIPPSVNAMYRNLSVKGRRGRVKTKAYLAWLGSADAYYLAQKRIVTPITGPCELHIKIPASTKGDVSNRIKACEDFLVSREITGDDKNNRRVTIERDENVECCVVTIHPVEGK